MLGYGGVATLVGIPGRGQSVTIPLDDARGTGFFLKRVTVTVSFGGDQLPSEDFPKLAQYALEGKLDLARMVAGAWASRTSRRRSRTCGAAPSFARSSSCSRVSAPSNPARRRQLHLDRRWRAGQGQWGRVSSPSACWQSQLRCPRKRRGAGTEDADGGDVVAETSFNPYKNDAGYFLQYLQPVYDTLIQRHSDGTFAPGLASSWGYVKGSKNTLFKLVLRKGIKSARPPLDAAAVKANLEFAKTLHGPRGDQLASLDSVEAPNPTTVILHLSTSDPSWPFTLSQVNGMVVSPEGAPRPRVARQAASWKGPYQLDRTQTVVGDHYTYVRNQRYWRRATRPYERIVIRVYPSARAAFTALRAGKIERHQACPPTSQQDHEQDSSRSRGLRMRSECGCGTATESCCRPSRSLQSVRR